MVTFVQTNALVLHNHKNRSTREGSKSANELLLCCLKVQLETVSPETIQSFLKKNIDWQYLMAITRHHGLVPILYRSLQKFCPLAVPQKFLTRLSQHSKAIARRNLHLTRELIKLLHWLEDHNISAIPFKGSILAASAYGDLSLRQFADLDILIHRHDATKVKQLMLADGYQQVSHIALSDAYEALYLSSACEYNFFKEDGKIAVEPHWGFSKKKLCISFKPEDLWHRLEHVSVAGSRLSTFSPEDSLLILCINGMKDHWCSLKTICDVAAIICTHKIDWGILLDRSRRMGCQRILFLGLNLAHKLLDVMIPGQVLQRMQTDKMTQVLTQRVCDLIFSTDSQPPYKQGDNNFSLWDLQVRERMQDKIYYLFNLVFGPNEGDSVFLPLPPFLYWAYPIVRPLRLVIRFGRSLCHRLATTGEKNTAYRHEEP